MQSARKFPGQQRIVPASETLRRIWPHAAAIGVTRLADITGLDRLGIPTYCAIVPHSRDPISVYNGKGASAAEAKAGALMEALERQTVLISRKLLHRGSYRELAARRAVLDPGLVNLKLRADYSDQTPHWWVEGHDLIEEEPVLVPADLAGYLWHELSPRCFQLATSNGLASGNCLEEAVCHALCELIERDAWTIAQLLSHWLPRAKRELVVGFEAARDGWDDVERFPCVDVAGAGSPVTRMLAKFRRAGLPPLIRDITSDLGIPTIAASAAEDVFPSFPQAHFGLGTHPNARVALSRALAELAQSRVVDIQGVREDLTPAGQDTNGYVLHARRVSRINRKSWYHCPSQRRRNWRAICSWDNQDIRDDIVLMLSRLRERGITRVVVVDFTPPDAPYAVVRVIVPGLESWAADQSRIGRRALNAWRESS